MHNLWQCYIFTSLGDAACAEHFWDVVSPRAFNIFSTSIFTVSLWKMWTSFQSTIPFAGVLLFNFLSKHFLQLQFKSNFFIQFYGSSKSCAVRSYILVQDFVFGIFAARAQLRSCRNQHFCNVLIFISNFFLCMIWPLLLSQPVLNTTERFQLMSVILLLHYRVTLYIRMSISVPFLYIAILAFLK